MSWKFPRSTWSFQWWFRWATENSPCRKQIITTALLSFRKCNHYRNLILIVGHGGKQISIFTSHLFDWDSTRNWRRHCMNTYYINTIITASFARSAFSKNALTVQKAFSLVSCGALNTVAAFLEGCDLRLGSALGIYSRGNFSCITHWTQDSCWQKQTAAKKVSNEEFLVPRNVFLCVCFSTGPLLVRDLLIYARAVFECTLRFSVTCSIARLHLDLNKIRNRTWSKRCANRNQTSLGFIRKFVFVFNKNFVWGENCRESAQCMLSAAV